MTKIPVEFISSAVASNDVSKSWDIQSGVYQAQCAIPPEFGGKGEGFSPEDLFLQAAINCFVGTFKVVAQMSRVSFAEVQVSGRLSVDKNDEGKVVMKTVHLDIKVKGADRPDRVETLVAKTLRDGFILNSIKSDLSHSLELL